MKTLIAYYSRGGTSGPEGAQGQLKENCAGANVHSGARLNKVSEEAVKKWIGETP